METLLQINLCVSSTVCLWSAFLLAYNWQGVRQRRWLSLVLFLWGLAWAGRAYGLFFGGTGLRYDTVLQPGLILSGIVAGFTFLVWPLTVLTSPRIKPRTILKFCIPFLLCVTIYYLTINLFGLKQFRFTSLNELLSHISYFSVWFRFVMCACLLFYLVFTVKVIISSIGQYNRYVEENCSDSDKYTINWMYKYLFGLAAITIFFFINLCLASYTTFIFHNIAACIFLGWLAAKVMVYDTPYVPDISDFVVPEQPKPEGEGEDFNSKFGSYKQQIELWLVNERPYLSTDFNLKDVMTHFGLNRTYASKIFNEGFGKSFILVVREYRMEYAKKVIDSNPSIPMSEVAHLCGYSTPQAFHKAFVYCNNGLTPGKYAQTKFSNI